MTVRSVTVALRAGVAHAVLPDNRSMVPGTNYVIGYDDYKVIASGTALETAVEVVSINTSSAVSREGIDLTTNTASLPTYTVGGVTYHRKLGQVTEGFNRELFRLVLLGDSVDVVAGDVVYWASKADHKVTADLDGASVASPVEFAGVAVASGTHARYIWVQVDGLATANVSGDVAQGDAVQLDPTADKTLRGAFLDEVHELTMSGWTSTKKFKLTFRGEETATFITRGSTGAASDVQAALEALSTIGSGNVSVSGTTDAGPFTTEFVGDLANQSITDLITVTSADSGVTGTDAITQAGGVQEEGTVEGRVVGTATTTPSSNLSDIQLAWPGSSATSRRPRHDRRNKNIFTPV